MRNLSPQYHQLLTLKRQGHSPCDCIQLLWWTGEKTDHFSYINELTVQRMNFVSPAPSSPPKEIMEVIKHLDVFHMDISTSYKVKVDQLGKLKTIRKDWKGEGGQGKQLTFKRKQTNKHPKPNSPEASCISQHATDIHFPDYWNQMHLWKLPQQCLSKQKNRLCWKFFPKKFPHIF